MASKVEESPETAGEFKENSAHERLLAETEPADRERITAAYPDYPDPAACIRLGGDFAFGSALRRDVPEPALREVTGNFDLDFDSLDEWNPSEDSIRPVRGRHRVAKQRGMARSGAVLGVTETHWDHDVTYVWRDGVFEVLGDGSASTHRQAQEG